jgi:hypothetical protein
LSALSFVRAILVSTISFVAASLVSVFILFPF